MGDNVVVSPNFQGHHGGMDGLPMRRGVTETGVSLWNGLLCNSVALNRSRSSNSVCSKIKPLSLSLSSSLQCRPSEIYITSSSLSSAVSQNAIIKNSFFWSTLLRIGWFYMSIRRLLNWSFEIELEVFFQYTMYYFTFVRRASSTFVWNNFEWQRTCTTFLYCTYSLLLFLVRKIRSSLVHSIKSFRATLSRRQAILRSNWLFIKQNFGPP